MPEVHSDLVPPDRNPCLECPWLRDFCREHGIKFYEDYQALKIDTVNELRSKCSGCKGLRDINEPIEGSYKGDLVIWWAKGRRPTGRTSRFSEKDIEEMREMARNGMSLAEIAREKKTVRSNVHRLIHEGTKKPRKNR